MANQPRGIEEVFRTLKESFNALNLLSRLVDRQLSANHVFLSEMKKMDQDRSGFNKKSQSDLLSKINEFQLFQRRYCRQLYFHYQTVSEQQTATQNFLESFRPSIANISNILRSSMSPNQAEVMLVAELSQIVVIEGKDPLLTNSDLSNNKNFIEFIRVSIDKLTKTIVHKFHELEHKASHFAFNLLTCSRLQQEKKSETESVYQDTDLSFDNKATLKQLASANSPGKGKTGRIESIKSEVEHQ